MPIEKVKLIEIYQANPPEGNKMISELTKNEEVKSFLQLLVNSEENPSFQPNIEQADPIFYEMIFIQKTQLPTNIICSSMERPIFGILGILLSWMKI